MTKNLSIIFLNVTLVAIAFFCSEKLFVTSAQNNPQTSETPAQSKCLSAKSKIKVKADSLEVTVKNKCEESKDIMICVPIKLTGRYSCDILYNIKPGKKALRSWSLIGLTNNNYKYFGRKAFSFDDFPNPNDL